MTTRRYNGEWRRMSIKGGTCVGTEAIGVWPKTAVVGWRHTFVHPSTSQPHIAVSPTTSFPWSGGESNYCRWKSQLDSRLLVWQFIRDVIWSLPWIGRRKCYLLDSWRKFPVIHSWYTTYIPLPVPCSVSYVQRKTFLIFVRKYCKPDNIFENIKINWYSMWKYIYGVWSTRISSLKPSRYKCDSEVVFLKMTLKCWKALQSVVLKWFPRPCLLRAPQSAPFWKSMSPY